MATKFTYARLFGDNISDNIRNKIEARQNLNVGVDFGESIQSGVNNTNYDGNMEMSSRIPWARMWSVIQNYSLSPSIDELQQKALENSENVQADVIVHDTKLYVIGNNEISNYEQNNSVGSSISKDFLSENEFNKPNSGIKSVNVSTIGKGLVKETIVSFQVFNYFDYENIIVPYFMTPGSRVFVDFGWDTSEVYSPVDFIKGYGTQSAIFDYESFNEKIFGEPNGVLTKSKGDMEVIIGLVTKFDVKIDDAGHFDCTVTLTSQNYSLIDYNQDTGINIPSTIKKTVWDKISKRIKKDSGGEVNFEKSSDGSYGDISKDLLSLYLGPNSKVSFFDTDSETNVKFPLIPKVSYETGIYYRLVDDMIVSDVKEVKNVSVSSDIYITFEYFAEVLNSILSFGAMNDVNTFTDGDIKFDFSNTPIGFDEYLFVRQLYSSKWGSGNLPFLYPTRYTDPFVDRGLLSETPEDLTSADAVSSMDHVNLSDIFIKLDVVTSAFSRNNSIEMAIAKILDKINDSSFGFLSLNLMDDGTIGDKIKICDTKSFPEKSLKIKGDSEYDIFEFKTFSPNTIMNSVDLSMNLSNSALGNRIALQGMSASTQLFPVSEQMKVDIAIKDANSSVGENQFYIHLPVPSQSTGESFLNRSMGIFTNTTIKEEKPADWIDDDSDKIDKKNLQIAFSNISKFSNLKIKEPGETKTIESTEDKEKDLTDRENAKLFPKEIFVDNLNNFFKFKLNSKQVRNKTANVVLPYSLSFSIYGISGLVPGNKFMIDYLPKRYKDNYFL